MTSTSLAIFCCCLFADVLTATSVTADGPRFVSSQRSDDGDMGKCVMKVVSTPQGFVVSACDDVTSSPGEEPMPQFWKESENDVTADRVRREARPRFDVRRLLDGVSSKCLLKVGGGYVAYPCGASPLFRRDGQKSL